MIPVSPFAVRRSEDGLRGELLLRLRNGKSAYIIHLSLEQARILAVEMRGLATDHCPLHHMIVRIVEGLDAKISHVVIKRVGDGDDVVGLMVLATPTAPHRIRVDAAACLATAIHLGIPIFMDGEFSPSAANGSRHSHSDHGTMPGPELPAASVEDVSSNAPEVSTPIPRVFRELIDGLELPETGSD